MPTIAEDNTFTQVIHFEVEPSKRKALIVAVVSEGERWVRDCQGFVSSTLHASVDGRQVVNYAQWRTEADFHAFTQNPEIARAAAAIQAVGLTSGPHAIRCHVIRVIEPIAKTPS